MTDPICYKGFRCSVKFSTDDQLFVCSVVGIQDSLNFHGSSIAELIQSFHNCVDSYLEIRENLK